MSASAADDRRFLVADIGGTNTRVALTQGPHVRVDTIRRFKNAEAAGLGQILRQYLAEQGDLECDGCCLAAAGPQQEGRIALVNIDWVIDPVELQALTGIASVVLLNDLQALGYALDSLSDAHQQAIIAPRSGVSMSGNRLVVGVGTGFNAAAVYEGTDRRQMVTASECGHMSLPVRTNPDLDLAKFVSHRRDFTAVEDVLSGRGLEKVYAWLSDQKGTSVQKSAADIVAALGDDADMQAQEAARIFARILGTILGDLALVHLPYRGIFLSGGVARSLAPYLQRFGFAEAFGSKGRFSEHMKAFGVTFINDDYAALSGCAAHIAATRPVAP